MGLNFPIVSCVLYVMAYHHLTAHQTTIWDQAVQDELGQPLQVTQGRVGVLRGMLAVSALVALGLAGGVFLMLLNANLSQAIRATLGAH